MAESGLQQEYSSGGLSDQALHRLRQGEKQEAYASQNPLYGNVGRSEKLLTLATAAAKEKTSRGAAFKKLKIQEDELALKTSEQARLKDQFEKQMAMTRELEETRKAEAYRARKDAEPGFVGSLFGK